MRTIKELNKLTGREPALSEGQQLLVPASGVTTLPDATAVPPAEALGSTPARGLWVGSEHVRLSTVSDAQALYLRQCDRANPHNTLLVLYAPWCPHCRDMEDELERLAEGLSHVPSVRIMAVNGDSTEGRIFSREVLGVAYYPSIISFPAASRTFFKYKGRARDAEALLRFFNMTCCAREDAMWALRPAGARAGAVSAGPGQVLPFGLAPGQLAVGVGVVAVVAAAAAALLAARRAARVEAGVVAELDTSLGRMATLLVRALGTRLALALGLVAAPAPAAAAATAEGGPGAAAADEAAAAAYDGAGGAPAASNGAAPPPPVPALASASSNGAAAGGAAASAGAASPSPVPELRQSAAPSAPAPAAPAAASTPAADSAPGVAASVAPGSAAVDPAAAAALATAVPTRELTAEERHRLTRLTDDELIALVNSDPDLDKVLSKLLGDK